MQLAILLVPCALSACASAPTREVLVIDEDGEPVAGAHVRLSTGLPWRPEVVAVATTDASGRARVPADLPKAPRLEAWSDDPPRRTFSFGDFDPAQMSWMAGADPCAIPVHELWIGAVEAPPGERLVHVRQITWNGFSPTDESDALPRPWRSEHPRARWVNGFLNPSQAPESIDVLVEVFGKRPIVMPLDLQRASAWTGPVTIDTTSMADWPWAEVWFSVQQPDLTHLDPVLREWVLRECVLVRRDDLAHHEWYPLEGTLHSKLAVPNGSYDLKLRAVRTEPRTVPVLIDGDSDSQLVLLPVPLAGLALTLDGIGLDGATLTARAGRVATQVVVPTGERRPTIEMLVPVGHVELEVEFADAQEYFRDTLEVETQPGPPRALTWRVQR